MNVNVKMTNNTFI